MEVKDGYTEKTQSTKENSRKTKINRKLSQVHGLGDNIVKIFILCKTKYRFDTIY